MGTCYISTKRQIDYAKFSYCKIKTFEPGSIKSHPENPVIAFTLELEENHDTYPLENDREYKVIAKGNVAKLLYEYFIKDKKSMDTIVETESSLYNIEVETLFTFKVQFKEERAKEYVFTDPTEIEVRRNYKFV